MTDHIDQLLREIEELRDRLHAAEADAAEWRDVAADQACSGRTMSCSFCYQTAKERDAAIKERDEARAMMVTLCHKVAEAALKDDPE